MSIHINSLPYITKTISKGFLRGFRVRHNERKCSLATHFHCYLNWCNTTVFYLSRTIICHAFFDGFQVFLILSEGYAFIAFKLTIEILSVFKAYLFNNLADPVICVINHLFCFWYFIFIKITQANYNGQNIWFRNLYLNYKF